MNNELVKWFLVCVRDKYAVFDGRARRREYWFYVLGALIIYIATSVIDALLGLYLYRNPVDPMASIGVLNTVACLALMVPGIAVSMRRLHDVGKSGWYLLLSLIPLIGGLYLLYLSCKDSVPGSNIYGPNPKGVPAL